MSFGLRTAVGGEDFLLLPWPMPRCCERSRPMPRWGASPRASGEASERLGKTAGAACCRAGKIRLLEESGLAISCATFSLAPSSSSSSSFFCCPLITVNCAPSISGFHIFCSFLPSSSPSILPGSVRPWMPSSLAASIKGSKRWVGTVVCPVGSIVEPIFNKILTCVHESQEVLHDSVGHVRYVHNRMSMATRSTGID